MEKTHPHPKKVNGGARGLALCGVLGALAVAIMLLGAAVPLAMYIAPALAGLLVLTAQAECGSRMAWTLYACIGLLSVLFVPDKEVAFTFVFTLGPYPLLRQRLGRLRPGWVALAAKLACFNLSILAMYALLLLLFPVGEGFGGAGGMAQLALAAAVLLVGNIAFVLYDRAINSLSLLYRRVWQPRLHRMLGW